MDPPEGLDRAFGSCQHPAPFLGWHRGKESNGALSMFEGEWSLRRLKVFLVDDHRLMLEAMRVSLECEGDIAVVGEAESGAHVLPLVGQTGPDVVLLDVRM